MIFALFSNDTDWAMLDDGWYAGDDYFSVLSSEEAYDGASYVSKWLP